MNLVTVLLFGVVYSEVISDSNEQNAIDILKAIQRLHALNGQDNIKDVSSVVLFS